MSEPLFPEKARADSWQLAQLVPGGRIALPLALLDGDSRFYWTANCWMLTH